MTRIKLLNNGLYRGAMFVKFPVEVEAIRSGSGYKVMVSELRRVGFESLLHNNQTLYFSILGGECVEVTNER